MNIMQARWPCVSLLGGCCPILVCFAKFPLTASLRPVQMARFGKASGVRPRTVIITQGADPTVVAQYGKLLKFPVGPCWLREVGGYFDSCWQCEWMLFLAAGSIGFCRH